MVRNNIEYVWIEYVEYTEYVCMYGDLFTKQVDVLPFKNQVLCCKLNLLIYCHLMYCNDVTWAKTHH